MCSLYLLNTLSSSDITVQSFTDLVYLLSSLVSLRAARHMPCYLPLIPPTSPLVVSFLSSLLSSSLCIYPTPYSSISSSVCFPAYPQHSTMSHCCPSSVLVTHPSTFFAVSLTTFVVVAQKSGFSSVQPRSRLISSVDTRPIFQEWFAIRTDYFMGDIIFLDVCIPLI